MMSLHCLFIAKNIGTIASREVQEMTGFFPLYMKLMRPLLIYKARVAIQVPRDLNLISDVLIIQLLINTCLKEISGWTLLPNLFPDNNMGSFLQQQLAGVLSRKIFLNPSLINS